MRVFIATGEESGDVYGALLTRELRRRAPGTAVEGFGGARMAAAGAKVDATLLGAAVIGWTGVARHLRTYLRLLRGLRARWARRPPDLVVLVDNPGFNLRVAAIARRAGAPTAYVICPQVWAWGSQRIIAMRKTVTRAYPVLPFEEPFLQAFGLRTRFLGHPLLDVLPRRFPPRRAALGRVGLDPRRPLHVLLPGSRAEEVARHLPPMLAAAGRLGAGPQWAVVTTPDTAGAAGLLARDAPVPATVADDPGFALRAHAALAWTASGTATLELGLLGVPQVVAYRIGWINWQIARRVVRVPHVSLVNLILERRAVPELIQDAFTPRALAEATRPLLGRGGAARARRDGEELRRRLGTPGAAGRLATALLAMARGGR